MRRAGVRAARPLRRRREPIARRSGARAGSPGRAAAERRPPRSAGPSPRRRPASAPARDRRRPTPRRRTLPARWRCPGDGGRRRTPRAPRRTGACATGEVALLAGEVAEVDRRARHAHRVPERRGRRRRPLVVQARIGELAGRARDVAEVVERPGLADRRAPPAGRESCASSERGAGRRVVSLPPQHVGEVAERRGDRGAIAELAGRCPRSRSSQARAPS